MTSKTHIIFGVAVNTTATYFLKDYIDIDLSEILIGSIVGSLLPDLDSSNSWITQTIPLPYKLLSKTKKLYYNTHRTIILHSIYTIIISIVLMILFKNSITIGLGIGIISHIITDYSIKCNSLLEKICYHLSYFIIFFNCINYIKELF